MLAFFICNLLIFSRLLFLYEKYRVKCCRTFCAKPIEFYFCTRKFSKSFFDMLTQPPTLKAGGIKGGESKERIIN